jgi:hypothetical protein
VDVLIFYILLYGVMYLAWCNFMMNLTKEQPVCIKFCAFFLSMVITDDESWMYSYDPETKLQCTKRNGPKSLRLRKVRQVKIKVRSMLIIFFDHKGMDCSKRIHPSKQNSQFCILMWHFTITTWKRAKTLPRTLVTTELTVASWQCTLTLPFSLGEFLQKTT